MDTVGIGSEAAEPESAGNFPPRLVVRVMPPAPTADPDSPLSVEVRILNTSRVVDGFEITVATEPGTPVAPPLTTVNLYPQQDHVTVFSVTPPAGPSSAMTLLVQARSAYFGAVRRVRIRVGEDEVVDTGEADRPAPGFRRRSPLGESDGLRFTLLSDHPIEAGGDMFGYAPLARRMAEILLDARAVTPFTIGIQGGWGTGKSSLMQLLRQEIEAQTEAPRRRIRVAWFNAWTAQGSSALTALIRSVMEELDPSVMRRVLRRTRRSSWLAAPFVILASWVGLRALADDLWQRFNVDVAQRNEIRKQIQDALSEWADADRPLDGRRMLVVFVDDLDRCSPENIVQVFEAIRLYLDAPGLVFVIGYDHDIVSDSLSRARGTSPSVGRAYLEKIIQVDYVVPVPDLRQSQELARACARECGVGHILGEEELALLTERSDRNPRRLKRFLNTFVLSHQLDGSTALLQPDEHIKMLLLRMYFPELFRLILVEPERDILGQLIEMARFRGAVRAGRQVEADRMGWLFEATGVAAPKPEEDLDSALGRLEEHAPEVVVELSRNTDLFSLAWSLGTSDERANLLRRLRESLPSLESAMLTEDPSADGDGDATICSACGARAAMSRHFCPVCGAFLEWQR